MQLAEDIVVKRGKCATNVKMVTDEKGELILWNVKTVLGKGESLTEKEMRNLWR